MPQTTTVTATENEFGETSQARWYDSLFTFWDLCIGIKNSPANSHHLILLLACATHFNKNYLVFSHAKNWGV